MKNRKITMVVGAVLALTLIFSMSSVLMAQVRNPYPVRGDVYTSAGSKVPAGVNVTITDVTRGVSVYATTNATGFYDREIYIAIPTSEDGDWFTCSASYAGETGSSSFILNRTMNLSQRCDIHLKPIAVPPSVTVRYPNGGESIERGTLVNVSANATDDVRVVSVVFSYSPNNGMTWTTIGPGAIVSGTDTDGTWNATWNTTLLTPGSSYLIKAVATDSHGLTGTDTSNATFTITPAAGEFEISTLITAPWDQVPIHVNDPAITNALSLVKRINETAPNRCKEVVKWDAVQQKFVSYVPGVPLNNFAINGKEETPFAHVTATTEVKFTGTPWWP